MNIMNIKNASVILLLFALFTGSVKAQNIGFPKAIKNNKIVIGVRDSIHSNEFGMVRDFYVYVPYSSVDTSKKYPVLYVLDGEEAFISTVGLVYNLSVSWGGAVMPEMIVVGIPHAGDAANRMHEYTPTIEIPSSFPSEPPISKGRGSLFLNYLEHELIPYVDSKYPTTSYRSYVGHSFGGVSVIYALLDRPHLFDNYVSMDPSLWWGEQLLLKRAKSTLDTLNLAGKSLFVAMANTLPPGMDLEALKKSDSKERTLEHPKSILDFTNVILPQAKTELKFNSKFYENESHLSVSFISTLDAFRWLFSWYNNEETINTILKSDITPDAAVKELKRFYKIRGKRLKSSTFPPRNLVNYLANNLTQNGKTETALAFYTLNIKNFPDDPAVYEAMGKYYALQNEPKKAIKSFKRAIKKGAGKNVQALIDVLSGIN
jgi:predicted alpha/beta superfamily hydrolase